MINEKYCRDSEKEKEKNVGKKVISDDSYAICEFLEELRRTIQIGNPL